MNGIKNNFDLKLYHGTMQMQIAAIDSLDVINISELHFELWELQENIVNEIQVSIVMLEEDLEIEIDSKEKFKELMKRNKEK